MDKKRLETLVGLFVLLGLAGLVFLALKAANLASFSSGDNYTLQARFDNIGGLKARAPVRSAGVTVGRVTAIQLDPKTFQGVVTLEVKRGIEFPKDSSAKILTAGLLGDQYVGIEPGGDEKNFVAGRCQIKPDPIGRRAREPDRSVPVQQAQLMRAAESGRARNEPRLGLHWLGDGLFAGIGARPAGLGRRA